MLHRTRRVWGVGVLMALVMLSASVTEAEAQRRRTAGRRMTRAAVRVGAPVYRPHYGFGYRYGLYPYDYYYPGYYYPAYNPTAAVRVQVKPEPTEVYVDGYLAGVADDFDGFFQRLRLPPGEYEIELRLDGYRSATERLLLTEGSTFRIRHVMVPLGPGETTPPPPEPTEPIDWSRYHDEEYDEYADPALADPRGGRAPVEPRLGRPTAAFGTLALRVQPADAEVLIDGERWQGPSGAERLIVEVSAGFHVIEVHKPGYQPFMTEIEVLPGDTATLNVSLPPLDARGVESSSRPPA